MKTLYQLIESLNAQFIAGTPLINMAPLLKEYDGHDWEPYKGFCKQGYKRNLIYRGEYFECLLLCWSPGQMSGIHDHPENGCLLKVIDGELVEEEYRNGEKEPMCINTLHNGGVSYKVSNQILHCIKNVSEKCAISLHIYAPPNYQPNFYS